MYKIKTFNNISNIIYNHLDTANYQVADDCENYDGILVRSADLHEVQFPAETVAIARAGAGVNNIPLDRCSNEGIVVFNSPGANSNAVCELVMASLVMSGRKIVEGIEWLKEQKANGETNLEKLSEKGKKAFVGPEMRGKKLGVFGLGAVGYKTANAAKKGLGMDVIGYDPFMSVKNALEVEPGIGFTTNPDVLFKNCDYLTLHQPLNDSTRGFVGEKQFAMMKDGAVLINLARGGLVDNEALKAALDSGKLRKYVTDFAIDELVGHPNVITLPHLGASTPESEENCADMAAKEIKDFLENGNIINSVNMPTCSLVRSGEARITVIYKKSDIAAAIADAVAAAGASLAATANATRGDWAYTIIDVNGNAAKCAEAIKAISEVVRVRVI